MVDDTLQNGGQPPAQTPKPPSFDEFEDQASEKLQIPRNLIRSLVNQESGGSPDVTSKKGAAGRWQVMPSTFEEVKRTSGNPNLDPNNPYDNIYAGAKYLRTLYDQAPSDLPNDRAKWGYALSKYHGGGTDANGNVRRVSDGGTTTDQYVKSIFDKWKANDAQLPDSNWDAASGKYAWAGQGGSNPVPSGSVTAPAPKPPRQSPAPIIPNLIKQVAGANAGQSLISGALASTGADKTNPTTLYSQPAGPVVTPPQQPITASQQGVLKRRYQQQRQNVNRGLEPNADVQLASPLANAAPTREELQQVRARVPEQENQEYLKSHPIQRAVSNLIAGIESGSQPAAQTAVNALQAVGNAPALAGNPIGDLARDAANRLQGVTDTRAEGVRQLEESLPQNMGDQVLRGTTAGAMALPRYGLAALGGGLPAVLGLGYGEQDWRNPEQAAIGGTANALMTGAGHVAAPIVGKVAQGVADTVGRGAIGTTAGTAANIAGRGVLGATLGAGTKIGTNAVQGQANTPEDIAREALTGAALFNLSNPTVSPKIPAVRQPVDYRNGTEVIPIDVAQAAQRDAAAREVAQNVPPAQPSAVPQAPAATTGKPQGRFAAKVAARQVTPEVAQNVTPEAGVAKPALANAPVAKPASDVEILTSGEIPAFEKGKRVTRLKVDGQDVLVRVPAGMSVGEAKIRAEVQLRQKGVDNAPQPEPGTVEAQPGTIERDVTTQNKATGEVPPTEAAAESLPVRPAEQPIEPARGVGMEAAPIEGKPAEAVSAPKGRIVNVNGQDHVLTPEQEARWQKEVVPLEGYIENTKNYPIGTPEDRAKDIKGIGMRMSAIKRDIVGSYTETEAANKAARDASNYQGKPVSVTIKGETYNGTVRNNAFGKVRVTLEDGQTVSVEPENVLPRAVAQKQEAIKEAPLETPKVVESPVATESTTEAPVSRSSDIYRTKGAKVDEAVLDKIDARARNREATPEGEERPVGEHGRISYWSHRGFPQEGSDQRTTPLSSQPGLRKYLGLPPIPEGADTATVTKAQQHTLDALAESMGKNRSSEITPEDHANWLHKHGVRLPHEVRNAYAETLAQADVDTAFRGERGLEHPDVQSLITQLRESGSLTDTGVKRGQKTNVIRQFQTIAESLGLPKTAGESLGRRYIESLESGLPPSEKADVSGRGEQETPPVSVETRPRPAQPDTTARESAEPVEAAKADNNQERQDNVAAKKESTSEGAPASGKILGMETARADASNITRESLPRVFDEIKGEIEKNDPRLSPNRAGELAAARIRNAIHEKIASIDDRARLGNITDKEEHWYDSIHVDKWSPTRDLEQLSGSRSIVSDIDEPLAKTPLSKILPDNATPRSIQQAENAASAESTAERIKAGRAERQAKQDELRAENERVQSEMRERISNTQAHNFPKQENPPKPETPADVTFGKQRSEGGIKKTTVTRSLIPEGGDKYDYWRKAEVTIRQSSRTSNDYYVESPSGQRLTADAPLKTAKIAARKILELAKVDENNNAVYAKANNGTAVILSKHYGEIIGGSYADVAKRVESSSDFTTSAFGVGALRKFNDAQLSTIASHFKAHADNFVAWGKAMIADFGASIRPKLREIWNEGQKFFKSELGSAKASPGGPPIEDSVPKKAAKEKIPLPANIDLRAIGESADNVISKGKLSEAKQAKAEQAFDRLLAAHDNNDAVEFARAQQKLQAIIAGSKTNTALAVVRAGLLTSPKTHLRNTLGNLAEMALDMAADLPGSIADIVASAVTGRRALTASAIKGSWEGAKLGLADAKKVMRTGLTDTEMAKFEMHGAVDPDSIAGKYTSFIFRSMAAEDRVFKGIAYNRAIENQARAIAKTEARQGLIKKDEIANRQKVLTQAPTEEMQAQAIHDADVLTFNNANPLATGFANWQAQASKPAQVVSTLLVPFVRTPTNIVARLFEASPFGYAKNAGQVAKVVSGARSIRQALPETSFRDAVKQAFTTAEQRSFSQTFGRASVGTALIALGYALGKKGVASAIRDYDELEDLSKIEADKITGRTGGAVKIKGRWFQIANLPPGGALIALGATFAREGEDTKKAGIADRAKEHGKTILKAGLDQPLVHGVEELTKLAKPKGAERFAAGKLAMAVPTIVGDVAGLTDSKDRKPEGLTGQLKKRIPGLRSTLPENKDAFGQSIPYAKSRVVDIFNSVTDKTESSPALKEVARLDMGIGKPRLRNGETTDQLQQRMETAGREFTSRANDLVQSARYQGYTEAEKREALEQLLRAEKAESSRRIPLPRQKRARLY